MNGNIYASRKQIGNEIYLEIYYVNITLCYSSNHKYRNVYEAIEDYQVESKCAMVS